MIPHPIKMCDVVAGDIIKHEGHESITINWVAHEVNLSTGTAIVIFNGNLGTGIMNPDQVMLKVGHNFDVAELHPRSYATLDLAMDGVYTS